MGFWVVPCLGCYNAVIPYWNPIFISCRFVLRSGIAWSCGRPIFNFSKNLHIVFHSHQQCVTTFHHILTSACWFLFSWGWPFWHMKVKVTQLCLTLCDPMDYTVHGILQASILEWVAYPFYSRSSRPRNWTGVSCIAGGFFTNWTIREALSYHVWSGILVWFVLGISLTLSVVEHLFMCLLAILISFLEKYLFSSPAHFLHQIIWGFVIKLH